MPQNNSQTVKFKINITNYAGHEPLQLNSTWYKNANGDSLKVTIFNYFVSNIKFLRNDSVIYSEPYSYHLIRQSFDSSRTILLNDIPNGFYDKVSFMIGVDAEHNVSGAQTGDLDPGTGMFWDWNTGYIMMRLEGSSYQSKDNNIFMYHFGGYTGPYNVVRTVNLPLSLDIQPDAKKTTTLFLRADVLECFKTPYTISINKTPQFKTECEDAAKMADNYADMFSVDHIE